MIWRFMVRKNRTKKYMTRIGQKTGTSKISKKVQIMAIKVDLATEIQNLNSGNRLMKGRNSSLDFWGRLGISSSSLSKFRAGSILGVKNARKRFR